MDYCKIERIEIEIEIDVMVHVGWLGYKEQNRT